MWLRRTLFSLALVVLVPLPAGANPLPAPAWTISASATDPFVNSDQPLASTRTLYLWYLGGPPFEASRAEMGLVPGGLLALLGVIPSGAFTISGPLDALVLEASSGCVLSPVVAAEILVIDIPGTLCIAPSTATGACCTADCGVTPTWWENTYIGYTCDVSPPCEQLDIAPCDPHAVGAGRSVTVQDWGKTKTLYR